ncbi:acyltransferase, partial [Bacteroides salyersiae]
MRNYSLDILKFLCAVLVVLLHIKTPWTEYILPITRAAVPCFFIISGYFLYQEDEQSLQRIKRSFVKVGTILLWSSVLYALFKLITTSINISYRDIIDFVLFNVNPFGYHLWYLSAYMYVLAIFYICVKEHVVNLLFIVSPLLLLTDLILGKYSLLTLGIELNYIYIRNFLFVGIP